MIWIILFVLIFLALLAVAGSANAARDLAQKTEAAKALQQRLQRETPDDELSKLGDAEFAVSYRKALKAGNLKLLATFLIFWLGGPILGYIVMMEGAPDAGLWLGGAGMFLGLVILIIGLVKGRSSEKNILEWMRSQKATG